EETDAAFVMRTGGNRAETLKTRVRIFPLGEKRRRGKAKRALYLGVIDGTVQTELAREMLTAKQMQQRLLPAGKQTGGVAYSYMYIPSLEIGGDLPDVYEYGGRVFGVLSDVSGKGISAGMLSAFIRAGFDRRELSVAKAVSALKEKFVELNQDERSYITVAAVSIDRKTSLLHYVLAGHNAPILLRNGRGTGINEIEDPAPPVSNWIENYEYTEKHMSYEPGDLLVLLSDGVTECPNTAGERFGIERVESVLMQSSHAEDFIGKLKNALTVFCGGKFTDDITAMAFDLV
ncbi:MAG: PP2C family protein-serine/threonine phosphatase, partial [Candidatus Scatosoma sp.]